MTRSTENTRSPRRPQPGADGHAPDGGSLDGHGPAGTPRASSAANPASEPSAGRPTPVLPAVCPSTWTGIAAIEMAGALEALGTVSVRTCGEANYRVYAHVTADDVVRVAVIADSPVDEHGCHLPVSAEPPIRYKVTHLHAGRHGRRRVTASPDEAMAVARAYAIAAWDHEASDGTARDTPR
ncbi:hypothetical protein [Xylanimonas ulmi]|uniref:Uncharacterized protein n=1 Tax=Xylanimonas ulmi TaxID=228973 RepID=A0A4Q7M6H8_9MICO|nr:hypothetical protein [Xylanibacterium ulmi]RZS62242.1 hypothetical protein EV386_2567 [Xylanibacterium ulmi]